MSDHADLERRVAELERVVAMLMPTPFLAGVERDAMLKRGSAPRS